MAQNVSPDSISRSVHDAHVPVQRVERHHRHGIHDTAQRSRRQEVPPSVHQKAAVGEPRVVVDHPRAVMNDVEIVLRDEAAREIRRDGCYGHGGGGVRVCACVCTRACVRACVRGWCVGNGWIGPMYTMAYRLD